MHDHDTLTHLLTVLRDRRIPLTRDDVEWAFESVKTQNDAAGWVEEYLQPYTLLSKEELELYEALCKQDEEIKNRTNVPDIQPLQDDDIRAAIEALESSTAAIDQQTKTLEVQMDALLELRTQNTETSNAVRRKLDDRKKKNAQEKAQLDFEVEGLSDAINDRVSSSQKQAKTAAFTLTSTVNDRFTTDDRMLSALSKLSSRLESSSDEQLDAQTVDKWCTSLVSLRAANIRTRVDRIFQETLLKSTNSQANTRLDEESPAEKAALKEELETLHAEISSVAQMSVDQDLRAPILQALESGQTHQKRLQYRWLDYILASLDYMTTRLEHLTTHATHLHALAIALSEITTVFASTLPPAPAPRPSPYKQAAAARARAKSSAAAQLTLSAASQQLLRALDISLPPPSVTPPHLALAKAETDALERLRSHVEASQRGVVDAVQEAVGGGAVEVQEVLAAVYARSAFGTVKVVRGEVEVGLEEVEAGIREVSGVMGSVQERLDVGGGDEGRGRAFLRRWGGGGEE